MSAPRDFTRAEQLIAGMQKSDRNEGLLVACKAAGLKWRTASAVLRNRLAHRSISNDELALAKTDYITLSQASAQRTLRFWQIRAAK
jgi:hypothetical protein